MIPGFQQTSLAVRTWNGRDCLLLETLTFIAKDGRVFTCNPEDATDGASTPSAVWALIPPFGTYWPATVLHDRNYRCTQLTREDCDNILLEAMLALGVHILTAYTIYENVRMFGQSAFDADRAAQTPAHAAKLTITRP